ncbi:MAG: hypothetical protein ACI3XR_01660 [Eubacteriales bacterium]
MKFRKILSIALVGSLFAAMIPIFPTSATERTITLDGDLSDWEGVHSESVEDNNSAKKATFYAVLTGDGDLYLACDAYHDVYTTTADAWHTNTNFEFFVNTRQSWVSAMGSGAKESHVYDYVMNVQEINGDTKYHTVTEVLVPGYYFSTRSDGTIQLGVAWKTPGDDITTSAYGPDNWWRPVGCFPNPGVLSVSTAGLYRDQTEAAAAAALVTPIVSNVAYAQTVPVGPDTHSATVWENEGSNYTLTGRGLGSSFNTWILGNTDSAVSISADFKLNQNGEQGFMFGVNNLTRTDIIDENVALYYLVDAGVSDSEIHIGIERNIGGWTGWATETTLPKSALSGDTFTLTASYDNGKLDIYINGMLVLAYTDTGYVLPGTGYGLCSKTTNNTISNVTAVTEGVTVTGDYLISTPAELNELIACANTFGSNYLRDKVVKITADLDMSGTDFVPLNSITLILDGQGHTVSGINIEVSETSGGNYGILANVLANNNCNGTIRNLTLKDSSITVTSTATEPGQVSVGAIAGLSDRGKTSGITLDHVTITVDGIAYVGGIAGKREWSAANDTVTDNVYIDVTIDAPDATVGIVYGYANDNVDGEISNTSGYIRLLGAANEVTSETLIAQNESSKTIADSAKNVAILTDPDVIPIFTVEDFANIINNLGGSYVLMNDLTLTEGLSKQNESAVFTGIFDGQNHTITLNCTDTNWRNGVFCTAGGTGCTIMNLTVDGTVTSIGNSCGGVVGTAKGPILFENITSNITITATGDSDGSCGNGGILGVNEGCAVTFRNCTSNASVTGVLSAGGFIGMVRNGGASQTFENCVFNGTVRCTTPWSDKRAAGGFIGIMHKSTNDEVAVSFKDCASDGTVISDYVLASAWVGSYARYGHPDQVPTYENCTQTAKVFHNGLEISKVSDTRLMEGMDSQTSGRVTFDAEAGTVTVDSDMAMNADTLAAKIAAGVKVYVGGVLDESAEVTSNERVLKVVSHDPTVKKGELITVVVVFSDGAVTTMSQSLYSGGSTPVTRVTFTHIGDNATSTDPTVNMNTPLTFDVPSSEGNTLSTVGHSAYAQSGTVTVDEETYNAYRFLIVSNGDAEAMVGNTVKVTFTLATGETRVFIRTVGDDHGTESFSKVRAAGELFTAADGCQIYGFAVYGNNIEFDTVSVALITADGDVYVTGEYTQAQLG